MKEKVKKVVYNLRQRPEEQRRHILHFLTLFCGIILLVLWVWSLGGTVTNPDTKTKMKQDLKPFSALKDNLVGGFNNISNKNSN